MPVTGQLWFSTEGSDEDAYVAYVNSDSNTPTIVVDNNPTIDLVSGFTADVVVDTAAGIYYVLVDGSQGENGTLLMGRIGSSAPPTVVMQFDAPAGVNNLTFGLHIDPVNERLYVGFVELNSFLPSGQGIRQLTYNPATGAVVDNGLIVTETTANIPASAPGADGTFAARDFDIDYSRNVMYSTVLVLGDGVETNALVRFNHADPDGTPAVSLINQALFPLNGDGSDFITLNGIITDVEVDQDSDRVYFSTHAEEVAEATGEDAIWLVTGASTAVNQTPTKLVLSAGAFAASFVTTNFYPGDMALDEVNNILYVESENNTADGNFTDVILKFQLAANGLSATLIDVINAGFDQVGNIEGMTFNQLAEIDNVTGTAAHAAEQGAAITLLTADPAISDLDGDHLNNATVTISGSFAGSGDNLTAIGGQTSGVIAGTNITVTRSVDGNGNQTLTFSGYDTFANYRTVLGDVRFNSTGDNPTNFGSSGTRTITWQVNDGSAGNPSGTVNGTDTNVRTTAITVDAVNDAPVNTLPATVTATEDTNLSITGISIADPDANPASHTITVTLSVLSGTLDISTAVGGGISAGQVTGDNSGTIVITATQSQINATLAAAGGLVYRSNLNFNGNDTLTVTSNDNGNTGADPGLTGTGTSEQDSDQRTITVNAQNDAPTVSGDGTETATAILEDTPSAVGQTVATLFGGQYSDAIDQVTGGSSAQALAGIAVVANGSGASGQWQYFNGVSWVDIGPASAASAQLLTASTAIRFNPAADFNGVAPTLTVRLVDASGAAFANGDDVDLSGGGATGGTTRYSTGTVVLGQDVTPVNDLPVAVDDVFFTDEATVLSKNLFAANPTTADGDVDGDSFVVTEVNGVAVNVGKAITLASGALLTVNADGTFTYNPNGKFDALPDASASGASNATFPDSFTYTISGGDTATVSVGVDGLDGADRLLGTAGTDILFGGILDDTLVGSLGSDAMGGGTGTDTVDYSASAAAVVVDLAANTGSGGDAAGDTFTSIEVVIGSLFDDKITGDGADNTLNGLGGNDTLAGGGGNDLFLVDSAGDQTNEAISDGTDTVVSTVSYTLGGGQEIEFLKTADALGTTAIDLRGNAFQQTIEGNDGNNTLHDGGTGPLKGDGVPDTLIGHDGDDTYIVYDAEAVIVEAAGEGHDKLASGAHFVLGDDISIEYLSTSSQVATYAIDLTGNNLGQWVRGSNGANVLDGRGGIDTLWGMGGADSFRFSTALGVGNVDRIADFSAADDTIQLDDAIFTALTTLGTLDASAFKDIGVAAMDADDRILYNSKNGSLFYDADGSGSGSTPIKFAMLSPGLALTAADFVVI